MIGFVFKNSCSPDSVSLLKPFARFLHAHIHKRQQVAMGKVSRASTPKEEECSTAVAEKDPLEGWEVFKGWDMPDIRDIVVSFCAPSPGQKFNQIAVADRRFNTTWRRQWYQLCTKMLRNAIRWLHPCCPRCTGGESTLLLVDLEDVFNTGYAAAEATRRKIRAAAGEIAARRLDEMVAEELAERTARAALHINQCMPMYHMTNGRFANNVPRTPRGPRGWCGPCWCAPHCGRCRPQSPDSESIDHEPRRPQTPDSESTDYEPPAERSDEGSDD